MKQIGSRVKNLYALKVEDACKVLRSKVVVSDLVVGREQLSLSMSLRSSLRKLWRIHNWRCREETEWKSPLKKRPPGGENFKPEGKRDYMQLYLQV